MQEPIDNTLAAQPRRARRQQRARRKIRVQDICLQLKPGHVEGDARVPAIIPRKSLRATHIGEILLCSRWHGWGPPRLGTAGSSLSGGGLMSTDSTTLTVPDDRSPRCWGSLITGSLDLCAPEFAPGVHDANATCRPGPAPRPPPALPDLHGVDSCNRPLTRRCCPYEEQVLRNLPREHRR